MHPEVSRQPVAMVALTLRQPGGQSKYLFRAARWVGRRPPALSGARRPLLGADQSEAVGGSTELLCETDVESIIQAADSRASCRIAQWDRARDTLE